MADDQPRMVPVPPSRALAAIASVFPSAVSDAYRATAEREQVGMELMALVADVSPWALPQVSAEVNRRAELQHGDGTTVGQTAAMLSVRDDIRVGRWRP